MSIKKLARVTPFQGRNLVDCGESDALSTKTLVQKTGESDALSADDSGSKKTGESDALLVEESGAIHWRE